jgi:hypothetical protein
VAQLGGEQQLQPAVRQQHAASDPKAVQQLFQLALVIGVVTGQWRRPRPQADLVELLDPVDLAGLGSLQAVDCEAVAEAVAVQVRAQNIQQGGDGVAPQEVEQVPEQAEVEPGALRYVQQPV